MPTVSIHIHDIHFIQYSLNSVDFFIDFILFTVTCGPNEALVVSGKCIYRAFYSSFVVVSTYGIDFFTMFVCVHVLVCMFNDGLEMFRRLKRQRQDNNGC